jgi:hypothetical protein
MISLSNKRSSSSRAIMQLAGAVCFFLVIPFGIIFGVLHRLFSSSPREKDRVS